MSESIIARNVDKTTRKKSEAVKYQTARARNIYIEQISPYLPDESEADVCAFGKIVSQFNKYEVRHYNNVHAIAKTGHALRKELGRDWDSRFGHLIHRGPDYSFDDGVNATREFSIVSNLAKAVNDEFIKPKQARLPVERSDGKRIRKTGHAIVNRGQKNKYGKLHNVDGFIQINDANIKTIEEIYRDWHSAAENEALPTLAIGKYTQLRGRHQRKHSDRPINEIAFLWLKKMLNYLTRAQSILALTDDYGIFPQLFEQRNGKPRFTGTGTSLQNVNKDLRHAALAGCWQYDIECCHHMILLHYAELADFKCPMLQSMVSNRTAFRERLAKTLEHDDTDAVKKALLIIVYGGRFQLTPSHRPDSALLELLGVDGQKALLDNSEFTALHAEIKKLFKFIVAYHKPTQGHRGQIQNALGQLLPATYVDDNGKTKDAKQSQKIAFILQGIESQAMQAMLEVSPSAVLPVHDAIVTREQANEADLIAAMKLKTKIDFTIERKQIETPEWV